jgi:autotransporter-associated beta strand protein
MKPTLALAVLATLAACPVPAQTTVNITTTGTAAARLTPGTGTTTYDIDDGVTHTFDNLATGTFSAIHITTAGAVFRTTGGGTTVFTSNTLANGGRGAGVSIRASGTLDLQNVRFGDPANPALGNANYSSGGALYASGAGAVLDLRNAGFYFNKTTNSGGSGGAVAIETDARSTINGALFQSNTSANIGGAILYNSAQPQTLASATFGFQGDPARGNVAVSRGGAIDIYAAGLVTMTNVAFFGNRVTTTNVAQGGGAIHIVATARATINGAVFEQNTAIAGGALHTVATGTTTLTSATFGNPGNPALGNSATNGAGGAIYQTVGHLVLNAAAFFSNSATNGSGGAIAVAGTGTLTINGARFDGNSLAGNGQGSAIHLAADAVATITSATFTNNTTASNHATVLITGGTGATLKTYTFTDVLFADNYAGSGGGALFLNGGNSQYNVTNATFNANSAVAGGAIETRAGTKLTLTDVIFTNNIARTQNGGAINLAAGGLLDYNATVSATHTGNRAGAAAAGGYLCLGAGGTACFYITNSATITIGASAAAHDTISTGTFTNTLINLNHTAGAGAGTLVLDTTDNTTQRGAIAIAAGRLLLANNARLGGAITVAAGAGFGGAGTLDSATDVAAPIVKTVTIQTGGTLLAGAVSASTAQTFTNSGTITLARDSAIAALGTGTGIFVTDTAAGALTQLGAAAGDIVSANAGAAQTLQINGNLAGPGTLRKTGAGTLTLAGANTFTGGVELASGTLLLGHADALGTGTLAVTAPATLGFSAPVSVDNAIALAAAVTLDTGTFAAALNGGITGAAAVTKTGAGAVSLGGSLAGISSLNVAAGALLLANNTAYAGAVTVATGAGIGGNGSLTAAAGLALDGATLLVGHAANPASSSGTLSIAGPLTLAGTARVHFGIHAGGAADTLNIAGAITTATAANIVYLTVAAGVGSGTYALGNATALAGIENIEVNGFLVDPTARIVSELAAGVGADAGKLRYIYDTDVNRHLECTGASGIAPWNIGLSNWRGCNGDTSGKDKFLNGDTIRFLTAGAGVTIAIDSAVTVSDMLVDTTGTLAFTGAALVTGTAVTGALVTGAAGKLIKNGAGALVFNNTSNTFVGGIALNAGTLATAAPLDTAGAGITLGTGSTTATLRALADLTLADPLTLAATTATLDTGAHAVTLAGGIAGTGTLAKTGDGSLTISAAATGENTLGAGTVTRVENGIVSLRGFTDTTAAATAHTFILDGGFLDLSDNTWTALNITGTGGAVITADSKLTLHDGDNPAAIGGTTTAQQNFYVVIDAGADGTVTLAGPNTYAGRTEIRSGTLRVAADDRLGLTAGGGNEIRFTGSGAALALTGETFATNRPIALEVDALLDIGAANATLAGKITTGGPGLTLTKTGAGTLEITGTANAANLAYALAKGTLAATPATLKTNAVNAGADTTLVLDVVTDTTYRPALTGAGALEKTGAGTLTLPGAFAHTGAVRIAAGALILNADNRLNPANALAIAPGAALDLRGTRQTAASLDLAGTLLFTATVNSNLGVILGAAGTDKLTLAGPLTGTGTLAISLTETAETGASPLHAAPPASVILIETTDSAGAALAAEITNPGRDPGAIFDWQLTREGENYALAQNRVVPVIPAVTAINAATAIASQLALDTLQTRLTSLRLLNNGAHRPGNDWFANAAYRHDTIKAPAYANASAITQFLQAGINFAPKSTAAGARKKTSLAYGIASDFASTAIRLPDAETRTKTNTIAGYFTCLPNQNFHAEAIIRGTKTRHTIQIENMPDFRLGGTGAGAALHLGYTFRTKSGWLIDLNEHLRAHINNIPEVTDPAHRTYKAATLTSIRAGAGVRFSRNMRLLGKWEFRPALAITYDNEIKGTADTTVLSYYDAARTRLREPTRFTDDLSGHTFTAAASAAIRFNPRLELAASAASSYSEQINEDYTATLHFAWRW